MPNTHATLLVLLTISGASLRMAAAGDAQCQVHLSRTCDTRAGQIWPRVASGDKCCDICASVPNCVAAEYKSAIQSCMTHHTCYSFDTIDFQTDIYGASCFCMVFQLDHQRCQHAGPQQFQHLQHHRLQPPPPPLHRRRQPRHRQNTGVLWTASRKACWAHWAPKKTSPHVRCTELDMRWHSQHAQSQLMRAHCTAMHWSCAPALYSTLTSGARHTRRVRVRHCQSLVLTLDTCTDGARGYVVNLRRLLPAS